MSGHLRTFKKCLPSQKDMLINALGCDVFVHTWSEIESRTKSWHNNHMTNNKTSKEDLNFIQDYIKPKKLIVEDQINHNINKNLFDSKISLDGLKNMTYGFKRSYEIMKEYENTTGHRYDYIIKIRPDILLNKSLNENIINLRKESILFFGNPSPIHKYDGPRKFYHSFRAMDILSICSNDSSARGVYGLYDRFEDFYMKKSWYHSPYLDYILEEKIDFNICLRYIYGKDWKIIRG
jgi:hypothetical protein